MLSPRLWRRLFRPNPGGLVATAAGDRRRVRDVADKDDLPAAVRHPDGGDRHRGSYPTPLMSRGDGESSGRFLRAALGTDRKVVNGNPQAFAALYETSLVFITAG